MDQVDHYPGFPSGITGARLRAAQVWLRECTAASLSRLAPDVLRDMGGDAPESARPYAHPYFWAAFFHAGDPAGGAPRQIGDARPPSHRG